MLSAARALLLKTKDAARLGQSRQMANWIKPQFKDGGAEPHELGRKTRQFIYEKSELVFGLGLGIALYAVGALTYFTDYYKKHMEHCEYNYRTRHFNAYPYPERIEE